MPAKRTSRVATGSPRGGAVDDFLAALDGPQKPVVAALREVMLGLDSRVEEEVKWNAPSFRLAGRDHFATFRLMPSGEAVQVILHSGAKARATPVEFRIEDPARLLKWPAKDRAVAAFRSAAEVEAHRDALGAIVRSWIAQLPPE